MQNQGIFDIGSWCFLISSLSKFCQEYQPSPPSIATPPLCCVCLPPSSSPPPFAHVHILSPLPPLSESIFVSLLHTHIHTHILSKLLGHWCIVPTSIRERDFLLPCFLSSALCSRRHGDRSGTCICVGDDKLFCSLLRCGQLVRPKLEVEARWIFSKHLHSSSYEGREIMGFVL